MAILDACRDPELFGQYFRNRETWGPWFAWLAALFALPMTPEQLEVYRQCTGRTEPLAQPFAEGWLICGRRAGKSLVLSVVAVYLSVFRSYAAFLGPGERPT